MNKIYIQNKLKINLYLISAALNKTVTMIEQALCPQ